MIQTVNSLQELLCVYFTLIRGQWNFLHRFGVERPKPEILLTLSKPEKQELLIKATFE
jgi:hypothetical protein